MKRRTTLEFKELVAIHPAALRAKRGLISVGFCRVWVDRRRGRKFEEKTSDTISGMFLVTTRERSPNTYWQAGRFAIHPCPGSIFCTEEGSYFISTMCNSHERKVTESQSIFFLLFSIMIWVKQNKVWNVFVDIRRNPEVQEVLSLKLFHLEINIFEQNQSYSPTSLWVLQIKVKCTWKAPKNISNCRCFSPAVC